MTDAEMARPAANSSRSVIANSIEVMYSLLEALESDWADEVSRLKKLQEERVSSLNRAERESRRRLGNKLSEAGELRDPSALGVRLKARLEQFDNPRIAQLETYNSEPATRRLDRRQPTPSTTTQVVEEWNELAHSTVRQVDRFVAAYATWRGSLLKRQRQRPVVPEELWRALARLDLLHRSWRQLHDEEVALELFELIQDLDASAEREAEQFSLVLKAKLDRAKLAIEAVESTAGIAGLDWSVPGWQEPAVNEGQDHVVRLGAILPRLPDHIGLTNIPAIIEFPPRANLDVGAEVCDRQLAISFVKALMLRFLAAVPPGNLEFTVFDPVSLGQSVAEFRHLAEYDSALMDEKTWTTERDVERLLTDISTHLELVISRYLRGQFDNIDDFNEHAGEVAQRYRFLIIFDYPNNFSTKAKKLLLSVIENGPRCGVYTILHHGKSQATDERFDDVTLDRLLFGMQHVVFGEQRSPTPVKPSPAPGSGKNALGTLGELNRNDLPRFRGNRCG